MTVAAAWTERPGRRTWVALAVAVLATAGAVYGAVAVVRGDARAQTGAIAAATIVAGCSFSVAGIVALLRYPRRDVGLMLSLIGLLLLASSMAQSNSALPFTAGLVIGLLPAAVLAHLVLRFPDDQLHSGHERLLVTLIYIDVTVLQVAMLMFMGPEHLTHCPCPRNLLFTRHDEAIHGALMGAQRFLGVALIVAVIGVVATRWRQASGPMRRATTPLVASGLLWSFLGLVALLTPSLAAQTAQQIALAIVPISFLFGLLQARLARGAVTDLLVDLRGPAAPGELRGALAATLRDPSLELAYWLPARGEYVDVEGRTAVLPEDPRRVTRIDRDGEPVAALVHDPALAENRALLDGVASAAGMALENERLQAELRAQLLELHASRARIVEAGDAARRRLERNLHDGAQQRLVGVSVALGLASERLQRDNAEASSELDAIRAELAEALAELRELARGLHPATLAHGLTPALKSLAQRSSVPVELDVRHTEEPSPNVAATAYYVVAEALTNVARYASASSVRVITSATDSLLELVVEDDGVGGAEVRPGSGLEGLRDRVEAIGGTLELTSGPRSGTRLVARLPLA